jgi:hypothetical protein
LGQSDEDLLAQTFFWITTTIHTVNFHITAGEWKGKEGQIINHIIVIGPGHYFVIIGGVLAMSSYVLEKNHNRKDMQNPHQPATL